MNLCLLLLMCGQATDGSTSKDVVKDDIVIIIAKTSGCAASDMIQQRFNSKKIRDKVAVNDQKVYIIHGDKFPKYLQAHKIKWFPTIIRFKKVPNGYKEQKRFIGLLPTVDILDFLTSPRKVLPKRIPPQFNPT